MRRGAKSSARPWESTAPSAPQPDWIAANCEDYGNRQDRRFRCARGGKPAYRGDDRHLTPNEIGRQCWQPIDLIVGPAVFDFDVLALGIADFIQALADCINQILGVVSREFFLAY